MNMKKIAALLMALLLSVTMLLSGCGSDDKKQDEKKDETTTAAEETTVAEETTAADVEANEDEENSDVELGEPGSMTYSAPGTKGFTLEQLRTALVKFGESGDIFYINQFTLYKSDEIVNCMIENINCNGDMELSSELCTNANMWGSDNFDYLREKFMDESFAPSDVTCVFSIDADGTDLNGLNSENENFAENNSKDFYELVKEAVTETYTDEAEKVAYKSLCYAEVGISEDLGDMGTETSYENILVIETDAGYFLLLDIPDID